MVPVHIREEMCAVCGMNHWETPKETTTDHGTETTVGRSEKQNNKSDAHVEYIRYFSGIPEYGRSGQEGHKQPPQTTPKDAYPRYHSAGTSHSYSGQTFGNSGILPGAGKHPLLVLEHQLEEVDRFMSDLIRSIREIETELAGYRKQDEIYQRKEAVSNSWWSFISAGLGLPLAESREDRMTRKVDFIERSGRSRTKKEDLFRKQISYIDLNSLRELLQQQIAQGELREMEESYAREQAARANTWKVETATGEQQRREQGRQSRKRSGPGAKSGGQTVASRHEEKNVKISTDFVTESLIDEEQQGYREGAMDSAGMGSRFTVRPDNVAERQDGTLFSSSTENACAHRGGWTKIQGPRKCGHCSRAVNIFAFQCSSCEKVACAGCRND